MLSRDITLKIARSFALGFHWRQLLYLEFDEDGRLLYFASLEFVVIP